MLNTLRRVAAGHNAAGRSVMEINGPPANTVPRGQGGGVDDIWITSAVLADNVQVLADPVAGEISLELPTGGVRLRLPPPPRR